jgi:hypothetical protein
MEDFFEMLAKVKMNAVFANCSEDKEIYPLTTHEIADAQRTDATYKHLFKHNAVIDEGLEIKVIENTICVCKEGQLVIPIIITYSTLNTRLEETMKAVMYWKGICTTISTITKSCKTCSG